jgi:hypothetical protein
MASIPLEGISLFAEVQHNRQIACRLVVKDEELLRLASASYAPAWSVRCAMRPFPTSDGSPRVESG